MAKARALDKRRKSIRNIKKITRTMELIATARFKKAMDRATAATAYTQRITQVVRDLAAAGLEVSHPLLEARETTTGAILLVITGNRGLCGGYNSSVMRSALARHGEFLEQEVSLRLEVAGRRGISACKFRDVAVDESFTQFEDRPRFEEVDEIATRYLDAFAVGEIDRLDVAYTQFHSTARQSAVVETLLPLGGLDGSAQAPEGEGSAAETSGESMYEFLPSAESILQEVVPTSFKVKLFKCFLDVPFELSGRMRISGYFRRAHALLTSFSSLSSPL